MIDVEATYDELRRVAGEQDGLYDRRDVEIFGVLGFIPGREGAKAYGIVESTFWYMRQFLAHMSLPGEPDDASIEMAAWGHRGMTRPLGKLKNQGEL